MHVLALAAAALGLAVVAALAYRRSLRRSPYTKCRRWRCAAGRRPDGIWTYAFGQCPRCGGSGRKLRLGCRVLGITPR